MSLIERSPTYDPEVKAAEDKVNQAFSNNPTGFVEGFVGNYEDFSTWFSSGLTGLLLSQGLPEDQQKDLYIKRNSVNYGLQKIQDTLQAFKELNDVRGLSEKEVATVKELQLRQKMINDELSHVYDYKNGDFDAPIDEEGGSFNDRWGISGEEAGILELIDTLRKNPKYAAGMLSGELIKDLPLSMLSYLGLTAKTAKGTSLFEKLYASINKIQPKSLRGLSKVAVPITAGAGAGAGYEASYSLLNEGKVNASNVKAGAEFGAAFGVLGSLGVFAKNFTGDTSIKTKPKEQVKQDLKDSTGVEDPREPVDKDFPMGKEDNTVKEVLEEVIDDAEKERISNFSRTILEEHESRLFPDLTNNDYRIVPRKDAISQGILTKDYKSDKGAFTRSDGQGKSTIFWNDKQTQKSFTKLNDEINSKDIKEVAGGTLANVNPNQLKYLQDRYTYNLFQLAHEKAHVYQNKINPSNQYDPHPNDRFFGNRPGQYNKEVQANQLAFDELERLNKEFNFSSADKSAVAANRAMAVYQEGRDLYPIDFDERQRGLRKEQTVPFQEPNSQLVNFLDKNKAASVLGLTAAGYLAGGEQDAPYLAAAGAIAALGTPALYRKLTAMNISQEIAKARVQAALAAEGNSIYAKQLEMAAQSLGDRIAKEFPNPAQGMRFLDALENGATNVAGRGQELLQQWRDLMNFYWRQGNAIGLWDRKRTKELGTLMLTNYVSHIIRGKKTKDGRTVPLTMQEKEDLIRQQAKALKVRGTAGTVHELPRQLLGTIEELKKQGYDVVDDPTQVLSIYSQSLGRALFGRKMLNEFKQIEMTNSRERPQPAMFTDKEFDAFIKSGKLLPEDQKLYESFDHPSLQGYKVHTNIKNILDDYFEVERSGGLNDFGNALLKLNNALKRVFIFGSLFHGQALFLSSVYSMGLTGAIKGLFGKGKLNRDTSWADLKLGEGEYVALTKEAVNDGLQIVNTRDRELVNPGKIELDALLDKLGGFGVAGKKAFGALDTITWEYLHDRFKLAAHLRHKEVLMRKGMDEATAGRYAAEFANDAFGSLDWNNFATRLFNYAYRNPGKLRSKIASQTAQMLPKNKRKWLNLGLFAPDWTISNLRIVGRTFWNAPKVTKELLHKVHKGDWRSKEAKEMVQAWNMYSAYTARAGFYTSALWWTMTEMFSDKEPTMENLFEFWFGEDSGKLDLGGGESQVISKQIAEPIHFIQHPQHTLLNKMSIIPKTMMEGMFNKRWFSMKKGFPMGPPIVDDDGTTHYGQWILGKFVPIVANPIISEDLSMEERLERVITGFFGFPQYGKPEDFEL